jgi:hypothetical protein
VGIHHNRGFRPRWLTAVSGAEGGKALPYSTW